MTTILLIDLSSIARPIFERPSTNTDPDRVSIEIVQRVRALASGQPHVAICCDSGRSFRHDLDPTYKANRGEVNASYGHQVTLAREALVADGFPVWAVKGFEADDLLASAVEWTKTSTFMPSPVSDTVEVLPADHVLIATSDKDMFQLVSDRVSVHRVADTKKAITVTTDVVREEFGVDPNQLTEWLMLVGDSSDNIIGAHDIGKKRASAMLTKYGNLSDLYAALDTAIKKNDPKAFLPSTVQSLLEFRPRMEAVRALVTLRTDVPLPFEEVFRERVPVDVAAFGEDDSMEVADANGSDTEGRAESKPEEATRVDLIDSPNVVGGHQGQSGGVPAGSGATRATNPVRTDAGQPAAQQGLAVRDVEVLPPPSGDFGMQLEPRSLTQAIDLAKHMHASRLFSAYGTPQAVLSTIMAGRELGLQSQASLRAFHIIEGKPAFSADLIRALCRKSPLCEYFRIVERSATKATWVTKRRGDPETTLTYTIEQGRLAWQKGDKEWAASAWGKRPENMLTKTASSTLARLVYDDVVLNMYCVEELTGEERD